MKQVIGQQGEVLIIKIDSIPEGVETKPVDRAEKGYIISHSESGHHHLLVDGEVMERVNNVPAGMQIFYSILSNPTEFIQDAPVPHDGYRLAPGIYEFRISREYNPFLEEARKVAD